MGGFLRWVVDLHPAPRQGIGPGEKRALAEHIIEWARRAGDRLDGLSDKGRREVLELLLDGATIDRHNNVKLTLAIPTEDVVSIAEQEPTIASTVRNDRPSGPPIEIENADRTQ